jgi:3-oxoadipate enol-lactonase
MSEAVDCDYSIQGSGPALFLSHGIGAAKNAWRFLLPELSKHFTVVTYDLRGHGNSPVTNKNFSLDDLVLDLEKIREKTKIESAHFAGHSLGGMIAPAYSIKFPNRVLSVGLLSTVAGRSDVDKNNVLKIISEMETTSVEQTLQKLTTRWFTDEFIKENKLLIQILKFF